MSVVSCARQNKSFVLQSANLCLLVTLTQGMDFSSNTKTNDGNINDLLYSGGGTSNYNLPSDPGSGPSYMKQPMNRPQSNSTDPLGVASNAQDKMAMLARLKEQQKEQF